jgi:uncharacterized surface protein with fasciclin (FAS1) repeats
MLSLTVLVLTSAVTVSAFKGSRTSTRFTSKLHADIVDTAVEAGSFKTLAAALTAANLVSTLKSPGPFTVFAPSDDAFAKLPAGTVESLLKDIPALSKILTYHVVSGKVMASDLSDGQNVATVNGASVKVTTQGGVKIGGAKVTAADISCDNGVIHVIDTVLLPKPVFNPKNEAGVSGPFGFFDPLGLCPQDKKSFSKFRESELKHGRVAMLAFAGIVAGEVFPIFFGSEITGPAIYQYQQAEGLFNAWSANVIGLTLAIEGFNIVRGWDSPGTYEGLAGLKDDYVNGDLGFDPLGLGGKTNKGALTKEINNGRLAMIAVAGIIGQELATGSSIF